MAGVTRTWTPDANRVAESLPGCDFADAFAGVAPTANVDAREVAARFHQATPAWVEPLMRLRDRIVRRLGLKTGGGGFPTVEEGPRRVVLGFNDRHLDFRIVILVDPEAPSSSRFTFGTAVLTHNLLGRVYLAAVMPFHNLISRSALTRLVRMYGG